MKKRALLLCVCLLCPLLLTSCLYAVQLNQRAIVQAVGIDWVNGEIRMTFQIFSPAGSGSSISATSENAKIITTSGATVSDAIQNATLTQGKQLFVGHNRIIILGRALAEHGLEQPLSYFSANAWSRDTIRLAVADGLASDILSAKINQGILPAETLEAITRNAEENGIVQNILLYQFLCALEDGHESSVLPVIHLKTAEAQQSPEQTAAQGGSDNKGGEDVSPTIDEVSSVEMEGMAVFSGAKLAGLLTRQESRGLLWLQNTIKQTVLIVQTQDYEAAALRVYHSSASLSPVIKQENGSTELSYRFSLRCESSIGETKPAPNADTGPESLRRLEQAAEELIRGEVSAAFEKTAHTLRADVLGLGSLLWKKDTPLWIELKDNWEGILPQLGLEMDIHMDIQRVGLETRGNQNNNG